MTMYISIGRNSIIEKALSTILSVKDEIEFCEYAEEGTECIYILDMGCDCCSHNGDRHIFLGKDEFVFGLTWDEPDSVWLRDRNTFLDARNFKAVQLPLEAGIFNKVFHDLENGWASIYSHHGMNLWHFSVKAVNERRDIPVKAICRLYPDFAATEDSFGTLETLSRHVAFSLHTGLAHRNSEDGLEGLLASVASLASDKTNCQEAIRHFSSVLKMQLYEFECFAFYLSELAKFKYSVSSNGQIICKLQQKQDEMYNALKALLKSLSQAGNDEGSWGEVKDNAVSSIILMKELLKVRDELKELIQ